MNDNQDWKAAIETALDLVKSRDEFLAMLAHELRNPIGVLANSIQTLEFFKVENPQFDELQKMMNNQIRHLSSIVDDLLDISRFTRGRIKIQKEIVNISDVINQGIAMAKDNIEKKNQTLSFKSEDVKVFGDFTRLSQVFVNIILNASKYTPENGKIDVVVEKKSDYLLVKIKDNGCGLAENMLKSIFEIFTQVGITLDRSQGGLGIGLSLAKKIIELHGGTITANSEGIGKGSEFVIRLPIVENVEIHDDKPKIEVVGKLYRILCVDDDIDTVDSMKTLLSLKGHIVQTAIKPAETFSKILDFNPQYVLLDIGMPEIDGYELASNIKKTNPYVVLVAVTGYGQEKDKEKAMASGFDFHLTKPITYQMLEDVFSKH